MSTLGNAFATASKLAEEQAIGESVTLGVWNGKKGFVSAMTKLDYLRFKINEGTRQAFVVIPEGKLIVMSLKEGETVVTFKDTEWDQAKAAAKRIFEGAIVFTQTKAYHFEIAYRYDPARAVRPDREKAQLDDEDFNTQEPVRKVWTRHTARTPRNSSVESLRLFGR